MMASGQVMQGALVTRPTLAARFKAHLQRRWPSMRRELLRDGVVLIWCAWLFQSVGLAWIATDSVHASAAIVLKGAPVRPGELAVFAYSGGQIDNYYAEPTAAALRRLFDPNASLAGPTKGDGFVKYLIGVAGDRIELEGDRVLLNTSRGRLDMGQVKPASRYGAPLAPIDPQVIPPGYVYMWAPHVDALDSRYAVMGLVPVSAIAGRAEKLW